MFIYTIHFSSPSSFQLNEINKFLKKSMACIFVITCFFVKKKKKTALSSQWDLLECQSVLKVCHRRYRLGQMTKDKIERTSLNLLSPFLKIERNYREILEPNNTFKARLNRIILFDIKIKSCKMILPILPTKMWGDWPVFLYAWNKNDIYNKHVLLEKIWHIVQ